MSTLNYTTVVNQLSNMLVIPSTDANFQTFLPGCIDYAEQRLYRELDLIATQITDGSGSLTQDNRSFILPTTYGTFLVIDAVSVITPSAAGADTGTRHPLIPVSKDFIDLVYPSNTSGTGLPVYYNLYSNTQIVVGPSPDDSYTVEVTGTQRPAPLSGANSSTILTQMLPDLFMAAMYVFGFGYMRDFGGQTDDPAASQSWEKQYQALVRSAGTEEARKNFESEGWTSKQPSPIATPPRV